MSKIKWETRSLEWIHDVREEFEREMTDKGMTIGEWLRSREKIDIDAICKKYDLKLQKTKRKKSLSESLN